MSNPDPKDDLDFSPSPPAQGGSSKPKKGARSRKAMLLAALVITEGAVIGAMALLWPAPAASSIEVDPFDVITIEHSSPDQSAHSPTFFSGVVYSTVWMLYYPNYTAQAYISFPLNARPATFTSAVIKLTTHAANFSWWNVSLITVPWGDSWTWNTQPPLGPVVASIPVADNTGGAIAQFNVTALVGGMTSSENFSMGIVPTDNVTNIGGPYSWFDHPKLVWTFAASVIPGPSPLLALGVAAIAVVGIVGKRMVLVRAREREGGP